ncbi:MAG: aldose 1-epimerase [Pseudomonadota bacterium]|nr:aldose 1-epimerase [Pseudomonadota bacterium]
MSDNTDCASTTRLASPALLNLHAGALTLELAPAVGGSIARFYSTQHGHVQHWLRPATAAAIAAGDAEGMASFPLVPFCNRIRQGCASFDGREIALAPNRVGSPHTIHGIGWRQPWRVTAHDTQSAQLEMTHDGQDWPYRFHAAQLITLHDDRLTVTIDVENRDTVPMPLGLGHHPYLPDRRHARLTVDVKAMWGGDAEVMPTTLQTPPLLQQLRSGVALSEVVQDNNFTGWSHRAQVDWPAVAGRSRAARLVLGADAPLDYFVLYSPAEHDFFCIEPVSNCTDWLNLTDHPAEQIGGRVVAPGERARATFWLEPSWP